MVVINYYVHASLNLIVLLWNEWDAYSVYAFTDLNQQLITLNITPVTNQ